jgi:Putative MetA-pathway of phenol degradation
MTHHARIVIGATMTVLTTSVLMAQTDYYNTDSGRPLLIEDAAALERRGLELQVAPVRLSRARGGVYTWGIEPELAFGIANRTQVELGLPVAYVDRPGGRGATGISGADLSVLYSFNAETRIPAFAIVADVLLPVGRFAPTRAYPSVKGIMTRTFSQGRLHLNAQYTFGSAVSSSQGAPIGAAAQSIEVSRWIAGAAIDHAFALHSVLISGELYARRSLDTSDAIEWNTGIGARYQLAPRWAMDAGIGRSLTGPAQPWYITAGGAYAFGLPWSPR